MSNKTQQIMLMTYTSTFLFTVEVPTIEYATKNIPVKYILSEIQMKIRNMMS